MRPSNSMHIQLEWSKTMHTCPLVSVFNEYIYIRYGRKIGFSWMYDWCWHSQVVANNLILKSVQKMTFCHAEFGNNGAEQNSVFCNHPNFKQWIFAKKYITKKKNTHFQYKTMDLRKKNMATSNLAFSIETEGKLTPPFQHHQGLMPCHNSGVGTWPSYGLWSMPWFFFSCFEMVQMLLLLLLFFWFQKNLKVGRKEKGFVSAEFFFSLLLVVVAHQLQAQSTWGSCLQVTWKTWIFRKISTCQCCRILISAGWQSRDLNPSALDRTLGPCLAQHPPTIHSAPSLKRFWYQSVITVVTFEIWGCGIAKLPGLSVCGRQLALCRDYFGEDSYGGSSSTFGHVSPLSEASLMARCQMLSYIHLDPKSTQLIFKYLFASWKPQDILWHVIGTSKVF